MSEEFEPKPFFAETKQFRNRVWAFGLLAGVAVIIYVAKTEPTYVKKIVAEPYVWPEGCEEKEYKQFEEISSNCFDDRYFLGSGAEYGWFRSKSGGTKYYRVGNDAIAPSWRCRKPEKQICYSNEFVKNVFVISGDKK